ncbi:MAG TPA: choice-of-anchor V domain-containing protein [Blastocatellia bacterium]|nr:choice-of-anchor V domain-containing protein [Blastocatellia bacterium]
MFRIGVKQKVQAVVLVLGLAIFAYARITGPEAGYTDAPDDIGNCVLCHDTFHEANVGPGSVRVNGNPAVYTPGQQYTLTVTVTQGGRQRFGYQLTAIDSGDNLIGTLSSPDGNSQVIPELGPGGRQYIEHTQVGSMAPSPGSRTWQVRWTAPTTDMGAVRFFVAGNAANNDTTNQGDYIYTNSAVSESPTTVVSLTLNADPAGTTLAAGTIYTITWAATNPSNVDNYEARYSTDDGATFPISNLIFSTTDPDMTSYEWPVPDMPTSRARFRITAATKAGVAVPPVMSGRFTITGDGAPALARITSAEVKGKKLFVNGENFQMDAVVELNGDDQKTSNEEDFSHRLKCKKAGKKIAPGQTVELLVRNPDGTSSAPFMFTRPIE